MSKKKNVERKKCRMLKRPKKKYRKKKYRKKKYRMMKISNDSYVENVIIRNSDHSNVNNFIII
jgi:hypothetical protein